MSDPCSRPSKGRHLLPLWIRKDSVSHRHAASSSLFSTSFLQSLKDALTSRPIRNTDKDGSCQPERGHLFNFPEFLHYPIRCALAARGDDLGLFIPARLNIYFSAQGEAEKKNVSVLDLTQAPRLRPTRLTFTRQVVMEPEESWDTRWRPWRVRTFCRVFPRKCTALRFDCSVHASIFHCNTLFWSSSSF